MAARKSNEPRENLRVPKSFHDLVMDLAKEAETDASKFLEGKTVVPLLAVQSGGLRQGACPLDNISEFRKASEPLNERLAAAFKNNVPEAILIARTKEVSAMLDNLRQVPGHPLGETDTEIILSLVKEAYEKVI